MRKYLFLLLFCFSTFCIGQNSDLEKLRKSDDLEGYIYLVLDKFLANPGEEKINNLADNFWRKPKSSTEKLATVILLCNKGYYQNRYSKTVFAITSYEKAWQIFDQNKLKEYDIIEFCLKPLGNLYTIIGDYDNAENTIKHYYDIAAKTKNQRQKISAILNLSSVYQSSGKFESSVELLENTIRSEKLSGIEKGKILNNLGAAYISLGNTQKAERSFLASIKLLEKDKKEQDAIFNAYRNLAMISLQKDNLDKVAIYFEKAKTAVFENSKPDRRQLAKLFFDQVLFFYKSGQIKEASKGMNYVYKSLIPDYGASKSIVPDKNSVYAETLLLDALDFSAMLHSEQKQYEKALEFYALSFQIEELFSALFTHENTKILAQIRVRQRTEKCISIYNLLYKKDQNPKWIEAAFSISESTKSAILKEHLSRTNLISPKEKQVLQQLQDWNDVVLKEQQKIDSADISKINEAIKKQNELVVLLKSIRSQTNVAPNQIDISKLQSKLQKDQAQLVSYFAGFDKLYAFTANGKSIRMQIFDKSLYQNIFGFVSYFDSSDKISNDIVGYQKSAFEVYKTLQLPKKSSSQNLIIIPDGLLNFVPFEALLTQVETISDFSKMAYFLNDFNIGYNSSAEFYLNQKPFSFERETVLGIFPVFENSALELSFSKQELAAIKRKFKGNYLQKQDATFKNFKNQASAFSILHLSTHADAGDAQTPASIRFYDLEVLYSGFYNLDIHPDLVVLSACETGIGKLYKGEGAMSVARGFQFAGAQNLLFSLWKVNDFTTSVQMADFYKNLKNGYSYLESNHLSKVDYLNRKEIPNAKKSPYYWSAMVYYGTLETKPQHNNLWIIWVLLIAIALFLGYRKFRKKNGKTA